MVVFSKTAASSLLLAALMAVGEAHMIMKSPVPYGKSSLNNSPLAGDGSDFPCKQRTGVYDAEGASNVAVIGEPQTLSFIGGATHGGGSCQVSLTTDLQPTKDTKWMVIKSIVGGCPSDVPGNAASDPNFTGATVFNFTIPDGIAPGDYTMSWSWFNRIGNREFYQNCAPMTVQAAKKKRYAPTPKTSKRQTSFPDMFVANIGNGCSTDESMDYVYPDPGADVQTAGVGPFQTLSCGAVGADSSPQQPTGTLAAGSGSGPAGATGAPAAATSSAPAFAGGNNGQYTQGSSPVAPTAVAPSSPTNGNQVVPITNSPDQTFSTVKQPSQTMTAPLYTNSSGPQVAPGNTGAPTGTAPAVAGPTAGAGSPSSSSASTGSSAGELTGACATEGMWNCIDGTSFQRCASGAWSAVIPMSGMQCTPGQSSDFQMTAGKAKRFQA